MPTAFRFIICLTILSPGAVTFAAPPTVTDDRLVLELVAREPDIVTPTGIAVDEQGRVWVIENQTHQRQASYKGPPSDRIRIYSDFDDTGKARKISTFADGFKDSMSIALGKDGDVFFATRSHIYLLRDTDGDGVADQRKVLVHLDTPGNYPHNGLSGFAFDALGTMYFAMGENLGANYKLIGSDGTTLTGGGEGGNIFSCKPDGSKLKRVATGFWNTFYLAFDAFGRLFAVDNDPDSRGPCRLLHIVQGGDYGYRYRNGRKGLHPFTAWNGELPGTLPMVAGTAEAPSGIIAYESNGLPAEYRGQLLVTSWGDHVVERFTLIPKGASFEAKVQTLLRGGEDFRPVGIAVGPDGSVYLSDWVDKSYPVHGKGKIWRLRMKNPPADDGLRASKVAKLPPEKLQELLGHPKREIRAAAGEALASKGAENTKLLGTSLKNRDPRVRIHALWSAALIAKGGGQDILLQACEDGTPEIVGEAVRVVAHTHDEAGLDRDKRKELHAKAFDRATQNSAAFARMQTMLHLGTIGRPRVDARLLTDKDPFLAAAALEVFGRPGQSRFVLFGWPGRDDPRDRLGALLAMRRSGDVEGLQALPQFLKDADPDVRRAAIQWVAEHRFQALEPLLRDAATREPVTRDVFEAYLAAADLLAPNRKPGDEPSGELLVAKLIQDAKQPAAIHALSLRMLRPDHPALSAGLLDRFLNSDDKALRWEAARSLVMRGDPASQELLRKLAGDDKTEVALRAEAIMGLAPSAPETQRLLLSLLEQAGSRRDALRSLREVAAKPEVEQALLAWWDKLETSSAAERRELAQQMLLALRGSKSADIDKRRKALADLAGPKPATEAQWREALAKPGDARAGERAFFHAQGARCFACHRVDGRGAAIGPDLSKIGRSLARDKLIESILTPSKEIAPMFVSWRIATRDGKLHTGVIVEEGAHSTVTLADNQGKLVVIKRPDIEERQALPTSLMPDNLHELMTVDEFRDLLAFLAERQ